MEKNEKKYAILAFLSTSQEHSQCFKLCPIDHGGNPHLHAFIFSLTMFRYAYFFSGKSSTSISKSSAKVVLQALQFL